MCWILVWWDYFPISNWCILKGFHTRSWSGAWFLHLSGWLIKPLGEAANFFVILPTWKSLQKGLESFARRTLCQFAKKNSKNILKHSNRSWFAFRLFQLDMFLVGAVQGTKLCKLCTCTAWLPCCCLGCYEFVVSISIGKFHQKTEKISTTYGHIDLDIDCICCIMISEVRLTKMSERIALLIPCDRYQGPSAISGRKICKGLRFHSPLAAWGMLTLFDCWVIRLLPSAWNAHDWGPTRLERDGPSLSRQFLGGAILIQIMMEPSFCSVSSVSFPAGGFPYREDPWLRAPTLQPSGGGHRGWWVGWVIAPFTRWLRNMRTISVIRNIQYTIYRHALWPKYEQFHYSYLHEDVYFG